MSRRRCRDQEEDEHEQQQQHGLHEDAAIGDGGPGPAGQALAYKQQQEQLGATKRALLSGGGGGDADQTQQQQTKQQQTQQSSRPQRLLGALQSVVQSVPGLLDACDEVLNDDGDFDHLDLENDDDAIDYSASVQQMLSTTTAAVLAAVPTAVSHRFATISDGLAQRLRTAVCRFPSTVSAGPAPVHLPRSGNGGGNGGPPGPPNGNPLAGPNLGRAGDLGECQLAGVHGAGNHLHGQQQPQQPVAPPSAAAGALAAPGAAPGAPLAGHGVARRGVHAIMTFDSAILDTVDVPIAMAEALESGQHIVLIGSPQDAQDTMIWHKLGLQNLLQLVRAKDRALVVRQTITTATGSIPLVPPIQVILYDRTAVTLPPIVLQLQSQLDDKWKRQTSAQWRTMRDKMSAADAELAHIVRAQDDLYGGRVVEDERCRHVEIVSTLANKAGTVGRRSFVDVEGGKLLIDGEGFNIAISRTRTNAGGPVLYRAMAEAPTDTPTSVFVPTMIANSSQFAQVPAGPCVLELRGERHSRGAPSTSATYETSSLGALPPTLLDAHGQYALLDALLRSPYLHKNIACAFGAMLLVDDEASAYSVTVLVHTSAAVYVIDHLVSTQSSILPSHANITHVMGPSGRGYALRFGFRLDRNLIPSSIVPKTPAMALTFSESASPRHPNEWSDEQVEAKYREVIKRLAPCADLYADPAMDDNGVVVLSSLGVAPRAHLQRILLLLRQHNPDATAAQPVQTSQAQASAASAFQKGRQGHGLGTGVALPLPRNAVKVAELGKQMKKRREEGK